MEHSSSTLPSSPSMGRQHFVTIRTLLEHFEFLQSHPWIKWPNHYLAQLNEKIEKTTGHDWRILQEVVLREMREAGCFEDNVDSGCLHTVSDIFPFTYADIEDYRDALKEQTPDLAVEVVANFLCDLMISTVDLYNGHTSLVFLYSNYAKGVLESEVIKVLVFLDYYGASLGIAGRSNNLAHKLTLEGRLVVREI